MNDITKDVIVIIPRAAKQVRLVTTPGFFRAVLIACVLVGNQGVAADTLSQEVVNAVGAATYEIVVAKRESDAITYDRPLPFDLLPFAIRNDPYFSIGTAFVIAKNRLVTAAHVLSIGRASQLKPVRLRDRKGRIFDIDQVHKFSMRRDFVVFSIKGGTDSAGLVANTAPRLNDKVYAVGNALGEGIVFRDGLYTSDTPEEEEGKWKWMRFSAAASPGNSGGPLLDRDGRVIGVVVRKSENENLNYSLPIGEVLNARDNVAEMAMKAMYKLDNMDMTAVGRVSKEYALPKTVSALESELTAGLDDFYRTLLAKLLAEHRADIFPNGPASERMLNSLYDSALPGIAVRGEDGFWDAVYPTRENTKRSDLSNNGEIAYGTLGRLLVLQLIKPDDVVLADIFRDSKLQMDLVLKGLRIHRNFGVEKVRVTSFGKASRDEIHTDRFQRRWIVRTWDLPHSDQVLLVFSLPVPGGFVSMAEMMQTGQVTERLLDFRSLTDFAVLTYSGTLEQWREFLRQRDRLPPVFETINIEFEYNRNFRYASRRLELSYAAGQMRITPRSDLTLAFSYFRDGDGVIWDVGKVVAGEDRDTAAFFAVHRKTKPPRALDDSYRHAWESITQRRHPYNRTAYFDGSRTLIGDVCAGKMQAGQIATAPLLYAAFFGIDGSVEQKDAETKLKEFTERLTIKEY